MAIYVCRAFVEREILRRFPDYQAYMKRTKYRFIRRRSFDRGLSFPDTSSSHVAVPLRRRFFDARSAALHEHASRPTRTDIDETPTPPRSIHLGLLLTAPVHAGRLAAVPLRRGTHRRITARAARPPGTPLETHLFRTPACVSLRNSGSPTTLPTSP